MKSDAVFLSDNPCYIYIEFWSNYHIIYTPKQKRYKNRQNKDDIRHPQAIYNGILDISTVLNDIAKKIIKIICGLCDKNNIQ